MSDERFTEVRKGYKTYTEWKVGHVYFATFEEPREVVKVGWSQNPWWRIKALGGMYRAKLRLIDTIEIPRGSKHWGVQSDGLEQRIHRSWARWRVDPLSLEFSDRGEWYAVTLADVQPMVDRIRTNVVQRAA